MHERCTCGAVLPEDARFCHKCGKPQLEEDEARLASQQPAPPSIPSTASPSVLAASGISFRNTRALWISIVVAAVTLVALLAIALLLPPLLPVVLCGAGFVAAMLYNGQSGQPLTPAAGARLGWMTGLWMFLVVAIMCALAAIAVRSPEMWEQAKSMSAQFPEGSKLGSLTPHEFLVQVIVEIPVCFFLLTLLPGLGGMLGAKLLRKRAS